MVVVAVVVLLVVEVEVKVDVEAFHRVTIKETQDLVLTKNLCTLCLASSMVTKVEYK